MKIVLTISFLAVIACQAVAQDYCAAELCAAGTTHIACNNNGNFAAACPANAGLVSIAPRIALILQMINVRRNIVARGQLTGFQPATRMGTVAWSEDLARFASLSCRRCVFTKDECRNTYTFSNADQKIFQQYSGRANINYRRHIIRMIQKFYTQHANTNAATMESFIESTSAAPYNGFAIIVNKRLTHVGCASVKYKRNRRLYVNTCCNYSTNNVEGSAVYDAGTTASACTTGTNPTYPGLCSVDEVIDPNEA